MQRGPPPDLLWDTIKCRIRDLTMQFLKKDRDADKAQYEDFQTKLASLYAQRDSAPDPQARTALNDQIILVSQEWTQFIDKLNAKRLDFNIGRKRQLDERSSKYFFRKYNAIPGSTRLLYDSKGNRCQTDPDILQVCHNFYSSLYQRQREEGDSPYCFIPDEDSPQLVSPEQEDLAAEITLDEMFVALQGMKKGKAPGLDGLTVDFYKIFWEDVGPLLYEIIKFAQNTGQLSISQKRGIIKLLPKKDKNPQFVPNLRPITLLNVDVKILTRALSICLKNVLHEIVHSDQQAFIKNRYIGNTVLDSYTMAAAALNSDEDSNYIALSLDIEKAFDSVSWDFLYTFMQRIGIPDPFIQWVKILHKGKELRIFNNGHWSRPIRVSNGLAQGCSLSPLLFILCMESLACIVRASPNIEGIPYANTDKRIGMIADDTMLVFKATGRGAREVDSILNSFHAQVGLRINYEKSIACTLGRVNHTYVSLFTRQYKWLQDGQGFRYLGLLLGRDEKGQIVERDNYLNFHSKLNQATATLKYAYPSVLGKILQLRTLLASKFVYHLTLLPSPHPNTLRALNKFYNDFIWQGGR